MAGKEMKGTVKWFSAKRGYGFLVDADGIVNFATIILRNDNPHLSEVITEFTESIQLLSQKPQ